MSTNQQILEKAIQKAIEGGWRGDLLGKLCVISYGDVFEVTNGDAGETWSVEEIIYNKAFAKALWGEQEHTFDFNSLYDQTCGRCKAQFCKHEYGPEVERCWQYALQQMVIAPDPIKYLGDNL